MRDGTSINIHIPNPTGVNRAGLIVCSLLDIQTQQFVDYNISEHCNEHDGLRKQAPRLRSDDVIVGDRNYGKPVLMEERYFHTRFVFRLSKHLMLTREFVESG